ncbi:hypothetical protein V1478_015633 [Vespula squamosa]|uniref:Uncharacterized protein n=1 Tax=Vespula squamosa TaxID=30214 RepID=A0ABD2A1I3_VESSQ
MEEEEKSREESNMAAGGSCGAADVASSSSVLRTAVNSLSYSFAAQPGSFGWFGPSTIGRGVVRREGGGRNEQRGLREADDHSTSPSSLRPQATPQQATLATDRNHDHKEINLVREHVYYLDEYCTMIMTD